MPAVENQGWCDHCDKLVLIRKQTNAATTGLLAMNVFMVCCFPLVLFATLLTTIGVIGDTFKTYRCTVCGSPTKIVRPVWEQVVGWIVLVIAAFLTVTFYMAYQRVSERRQQEAVPAPAPLEFAPNAANLPPAKVEQQQFVEVPIGLVVGVTAKVKPSGEPFVRLLKSREFFDRWHKAIAANDEAELLRITGDPSDPVFGVAKGESVSVIDVDRAAKVARVKVTTGGEAGKVGFVPFADLDAGTQRVAAPTTTDGK
jgi:hypothetical protein